MEPILERFASVSTAFRPKTPSELLALRLAQKLGDGPAAGHYATLTTEYPDGHLLAAFWRALRSGFSGDLGRRFHAELKRIRGFRASGKGVNLIAVRVERRSVAAAIFRGDRLDYTQVRHLSSAKDKALASAVGFINWLADHFPLDSAAVEAMPGARQIQRKVLTDTIMQALRDRMLPIWEVTKQNLFEAFGQPALGSRKELREVVTGIWPILAGTNGRVFIQDAAALGLFVQIERCFLK